MLGIDIGHSSLKVVEIKGNRLLGFHEASYQNQNQKQGGEEGSNITDALKQAVNKMGCRKQTAWGSVGDNLVITHLTDYPEMEDNELQGAVRLEAEQFISREWSEMDFDYQIIENHPDGGCKVVFVAAPRELSDRNIDYFRAAGVYPVGMSANSLAMASAFQAASGRVAADSPLNSSEAAIIDLGAKYTSIALLEDGKISVLRDIAFGGLEITKSLMDEYNTGFQEAEEILKQEGEPELRVLDAVRRAIRPLIQQISITIGYQHRKGRLKGNAIFLVGGGCRAPGLPEMLSERFDLPPVFLNPFAGLESECEIPANEKALSSFTISTGCAIIGNGEYENSNKSH